METTIVRQWERILCQWNRCAIMDDGRLNKKVFRWSFQAARNRSKNWIYRVCKESETRRIHDFTHDVDLNTIHIFDINSAKQVLASSFFEQWEHRLFDDHGVTGTNKLRTYRLFKNSYGPEPYILMNLPISHRSAFAKFRSGTAPIRLETGRYEHIPVNERSCFYCLQSNNVVVESEMHVITECPLYDDFRELLYSKAQAVIPNFQFMPSNVKFINLFHNESVVRFLPKPAVDIY